MIKEPKIPLSEVKRLFKRFVIDVVHLGDFDQGQSLQDTMQVFTEWWKKREPGIIKRYKDK